MSSKDWEVAIANLREIRNSGPSEIWTEYDEIIPGLFLGGRSTATDIPTLKRLGITHILNATDPSIDPTPFNKHIGGGVDTDLQFYLDGGLSCQFLNIPLLDYPTFPINHSFFQTASEFIHSALSSDGKVYVHCFMGKSRSATLIIGYLIMKHNKTVKEAVTLVREKRTVANPNEGFLGQLVQLEIHHCQNSTAEN